MQCINLTALVNTFTVMYVYYVHSCRFEQQLSGSKFQEKTQLLYILTLLKDSMQVANQRLPCIITVFLAKCCSIQLQPSASNNFHS